MPEKTEEERSEVKKPSYFTFLNYHSYLRKTTTLLHLLCNEKAGSFHVINETCGKQFALFSAKKLH